VSDRAAAAPPGPALRRPLGAAVRDLPAWPLYLMFAGFPLFWVVGLGTFVPILTALVMGPLLALRRGIRVPPSFGWWALFLAWAAVAALQLDGVPRLVGYGVRMSNYVGATVLFLYVHNIGRRRLSQHRGLVLLAGFFVVVVVGGWLGVLAPTARLSTPLAALLPDRIAANAYVDALVRPGFAEVQHPYGSPTVFYRPSAPFPYTNGWGCNAALLVPCVLAALASARARVRIGRRLPRPLRGRWMPAALSGLLVAAAVPALATLNRGLYLAIGVAVGYAAVRLAVRGRLATLAAVGACAGAGLGVAVLSGAAAALQSRLAYSQSSNDRLSVYAEALQGTLASPLLGNGAPRPSATLDVSVGTQGQIWNVMYSYGFPGLIFFLGWFAALVWTTRRWRTTSDLWLHVCLVVAAVTIAYYGYDGMQLSVLMAAAGLATREVRRT